MQSSHEVLQKDEKLKQIVELLKKEINPFKIYLFGSRARGTFLEDSDYDLAVIIDELDENRVKTIKKSYDCLNSLRVSKDIIFYTKSEFEELQNEFGTIPEIIKSEGIDLNV